MKIIFVDSRICFFIVARKQKKSHHNWTKFNIIYSSISKLLREKVFFKYSFLDNPGFEKKTVKVTLFVIQKQPLAGVLHNICS